MQNRGITRDKLEWIDAGNGNGSWSIHTQTELFGLVQVDIPAMVKAENLTTIQNRSLDMLRTLPKSLRPQLAQALAQYAGRYLDEEIDPDDCKFSCDSASVPYLHASGTPYIFLNASSDLDEEHGICFLIRDGEVITCCHGDESLEFPGWDATDELDALATDIE